MWKDLKIYLEDRLNLKADEFNRVSAAGLATIERLSDMLRNAQFAFLIMTGEDQTNKDKLVARMNVIHEAGLFQGRLTFKRAIVLLEDGCEDFSNIKGLGHIPFPKGRISAAFHEVHAVLQRENIV